MQEARVVAYYAGRWLITGFQGKPRHLPELLNNFVVLPIGSMIGCAALSAFLVRPFTDEYSTWDDRPNSMPTWQFAGLAGAGIGACVAFLLCGPLPFIPPAIIYLSVMGVELPPFIDALLEP